MSISWAISQSVHLRSRGKMRQRRIKIENDCGTEVRTMIGKVVFKNMNMNRENITFILTLSMTRQFDPLYTLYRGGYSILLRGDKSGRKAPEKIPHP